MRLIYLVIGLGLFSFLDISSKDGIKRYLFVNLGQDSSITNKDEYLYFHEDIGFNTTQADYFELVQPYNGPSYFALTSKGAPVLEVANRVKHILPGFPDSIWIDPSPTNIVIRLYRKPKIVKTNGFWEITFK